ncbi:hypothetical protein NONO_c71770 [Nocardia nova SH22a]|uniref:Uncharacterized protein n=1 Tax=Nocardia nova SH22a TaxID=1415166 RepID=W5TRF5_9NOCA|nr:hypothetical protein [Nocardia nova]AHH21935.1 hypothetical protein NONO_c71770 [Nocardia nova SH22a]
MVEPEPSAAELVESVIRAGAAAGYRIDRDDAGRLRLAAVGGEAVEPALVFAVTESEWCDYYRRLSANAGGPGWTETPWQVWMLLMSTHLDEAVYEAGRLGGPGVIVIHETGLQAVSEAGAGQ